MTEHIEAEGGVVEPATATLARRRGNRAALVVALARALGLPAELALARSPVTADPAAPADPQELDDFADVLVRFGDGGAGGPVRYVDPRWRHAPFGYLPPALDGALVLRLPGGQLEHARSAHADQRAVDLRLRAGGRRQRRGHGGRAAARLAGHRVGRGQEARRRGRGQAAPGLRAALAGPPLLGRPPGRPGHRRRSRSGRAQAQLRYSFTSPQLASPTGAALELVPGFFQMQPGRRFATERRRRTGLVVGVDTPLRLTARVVLPPGRARAGHRRRRRAARRRRRGHPAVRAPAGAARDAAGAPVEILIERQGQLPLVRVAPADYEKVAAELRRMDRLEEAEIRIAVKAPRARGR